MTLEKNAVGFNFVCLSISTQFRAANMQNILWPFSCLDFSLLSVT